MQAGYTVGPGDVERRDKQQVSATKVTHKLGNNGMYRKAQFVLLGVDGRGASERIISELGLSGIKKC